MFYQIDGSICLLNLTPHENHFYECGNEEEDHKEEDKHGEKKEGREGEERTGGRKEGGKEGGTEAVGNWNLIGPLGPGSHGYPRKC